MNSIKQQGKSLLAFLAGCAVALASVVAVLLMLNTKHDFKQPSVKTTASNVHTETLSPSPNPSSHSIQAAASETQPEVMHDARDVEPLPDDSDEATAQDETPVVPPVRSNKRDLRTESKAADVARNSIQADGVMADKNVLTNSETPSQTRRRQRAEDWADNHAKPTGEQILTAGNWEKAQVLARQEAREKRQRERAVQAKTLSASTETSTMNKHLRVQAGAYRNRQAANEQRAQLALMGVRTQVTEAQLPNGKRMYRVQTEPMDTHVAQRTRDMLQKKGIDAVTHQ